MGFNRLQVSKLLVIVVSGLEPKGALFADEQFRRAIRHGAIAILQPDLKQVILDAYATMSRANQRMLSRDQSDSRGEALGTGREMARTAKAEAASKLKDAYEKLLSFLSPE